MAYHVRIDEISESEWHYALALFSDASIYQTWTYGVVRWGRSALSHHVLYDNDEIIAIAQVTIRKVPFLGVGIAYIPWGPLWKRADRPADPTILKKVLEGLYQEYVARRGLLLRVASNEVYSPDSAATSLYQSLGFKQTPDVSPYRTLLLDLTPDISTLRANLRANWRNHLKTAERQPMIVREGSTDELFQVFAQIYEVMRARKGFSSNVDIAEFSRIQRLLPPNLKMHLMVCYADNVPLAAIVCAVMGDTGIYILGASNSHGLKFNSAYLLQWEMVHWLKTRRTKYYDLGGIDQVKNPSIYDFKKGLAGKAGQEIAFIGQFEACAKFSSATAIKCGDAWKRLNATLRRVASR